MCPSSIKSWFVLLSTNALIGGNVCGLVQLKIKHPVAWPSGGDARMYCVMGRRGGAGATVDATRGRAPSLSGGGALPDRGRGCEKPDLFRPPGVENLWFSPAPVLAPCGAHARFRSHLPDHRAPVVRERCDGVTGLTIEGHAAMHPAGRAVVIRTRTGAWIVPLVSFRRVACGEGVRETIFALVPEVDV